MEEEEKFLGTIIISNERHIDLFQVHIYDRSIRFDLRFANGIACDEKIAKEILDIDNMWKHKKIDKNDIFPLMVDIVGKHESYLANYYFDKKELNEKGKFVGLYEKKNKLNESTVSFSERMKMYYLYLMGSGKLMKISKKKFEKNMPKNEAGKHYLYTFDKNKVLYFKYDTVDVNKVPKECFVMTKGDTVNFAFCK